MPPARWWCATWGRGRPWRHRQRCRWPDTGFHRRRRLAHGHLHRHLDPGVILYLLDEKGMNAKQIETLLYKQSGLLGCRAFPTTCAFAGKRRLRAAEAVELFCYRIRRELGSLAAAWGLDAVVPPPASANVRPRQAKVCDYARWRASTWTRPTPPTPAVTAAGSGFRCSSFPPTRK